MRTEVCAKDRTHRPAKDPMCPSRLRCSTQVVTESTAVLFDTETAGDGAATARGTSRRVGGQCGWGRRVCGGSVGPANCAGQFALRLRDRAGIVDTDHVVRNPCAFERRWRFKRDIHRGRRCNVQRPGGAQLSAVLSSYGGVCADLPAGLLLWNVVRVAVLGQRFSRENRRPSELRW